eukprot:TRINITY_DN6560_c0_g1_i2.p4 TRINITY_DN6560_c0_g1~~TRINITY_DN6560_c0_g1_i2.p4  ORF type:complete len:104 (+),score=4.56 TRINITY_DN6560_c0_g1_i2:371-682(+)
MMKILNIQLLLILKETISLLKLLCTLYYYYFSSFQIWNRIAHVRYKYEQLSGENIISIQFYQNGNFFFVGTKQQFKFFQIYSSQQICKGLKFRQLRVNKSEIQ